MTVSRVGKAGERDAPTPHAYPRRRSGKKTRETVQVVRKTQVNGIGQSAFTTVDLTIEFSSDA
jgi:hypothetical protein